MKTNFFLLLMTCMMLGMACHEDSHSATDSNKEKEITPQVEAMQQLLQQHPDSNGLRMKLAMELDSLNRYEPALKQMDSLIKKDSGNYAFWYTRGQVYEDAGDTLPAIKDYEAAIKLYASPDAILNLANLYAEQKNDRSLLLANQVKRMGQGRETDASVAFVSGVYYARNGQRQPAINFFNECISNNYTYMPAYIEKGLVYFDAKQYEQALDVFSLAADVDHLYPDAYYYMGRCYELMNKKDSAAFYFKQSLALDKGAPETEAALKRVEK